MVSATFNRPAPIRPGWALWVVLAFIVFQAVRQSRSWWRPALSPRAGAAASSTRMDNAGGTSRHGGRTGCSRVGTTVNRVLNPGRGTAVARPRSGLRSLPDMNSRYGGYSSSPSQSGSGYCSAPGPAPAQSGRNNALGPRHLPAFQSFSPPPPVSAGTGSQAGSAQSTVETPSSHRPRDTIDQPGVPASGRACARRVNRVSQARTIGRRRSSSSASSGCVRPRCGGVGHHRRGDAAQLLIASVAT